MIDTWFKKDLKQIHDTHPVAVFVDESGDAAFLLKTVKDVLTIYQADTELEELHVKYLIEKAQPSDEKILIYTTSKKDELKFIREYCETNGCLEIRYLQNYIKDKVHQTLNLNINLPKEELIAAAKVSIGKDRTYWMDLSHKGASEIFDLQKELLPFIHDPKTYEKEKYDAQLRETFYRKVNELLGQQYVRKPAKTLAGEVVQAMLDGLATSKYHQILHSVYQDWLDSVSYKDSFKGYLDSYSLPSNIDIWKVHMDHPFRQVDELWLAEIGANLSNKASISNLLAKLRQRHQSKQAKSLGISFWANVIVLLEFDPKDIAYLSSFGECVVFYTKHFYLLDTAIRNLYTEFLNRKELLEPFQELYKEYIAILLDKWFKHWGEYKETQTGVLQQIIDSHREKTAVIVGDGVAYEVAEQVVLKVKGSFDLKKEVILADIPSETENNMSRIYIDNGLTMAIQNKREKYLVDQNPDVAIDFIRLDEVSHEARAGQILVCTYKDIDDMGEKLQQKALKYFPETIDYFADKISLLLSSGYSQVYLITDHGFVLTGLLTESDKISIFPKGPHQKAERYIRTKDKQPELLPTLIEVAKKYNDYNYLYFARNIHPFKTPGRYGFSHGGLTPQEILTPFFCWGKSDLGENKLSVSIKNKEDLKDVTGELFSIDIQTRKGSDDLFSTQRSFFLVFFANNKMINKSDKITIQRGENITKEYSFDGHSEIKVQLLDAADHQLLDQTEVRQNKDRDLGGLF